MEEQQSSNSSVYICWKNAKMPLRKAHRYVKAQTGRAEIDQPQSIFLYDKGMGRVDRLDQNIISYMIGHSSKKWWWPVFRFCLDLSVNNAYQLYCQQTCSEVERKLYLLEFRRSIVDTYYRCLRSCRKSVIMLDMTQSITG